MAVQTTYPGVYIQERPSGVHTITGVSTSVTAFAGAAAKGPVDRPTPVANFAEYVRTFGPPMDPDHPMGHAVSHFFANGGSSAVIVRVIASDAKLATATLKDRRSTAKDALVLDAAGKGEWANQQAGVGIGVGVSDGAANPNDLFSVALSYRTFDERSQSSVEESQETYANLSMSPKHPRYALNLLSASQLVDAKLASPAPSSNTAGSSVGAGAVSSPLAIDATNNTLRVAVDFGPPVDVVLFPDDTKTGSVSKTPAEVVIELNAGFGRVKVPATASQTSGTITVESKAKNENSAVVVSPAAQGDISQDLQLGLAWGGTEVSGAASLRPAAAAAGLGGGTEGATVTASDIVPADATGGIYALESRRFPRFNLLCLPGVTSDDTGQVQAALSFCAAQRGFLIVDPPPGAWGGPADTFPPNLGTFSAFGDHGAVYYPRVTQVETLPGGTRRVLNLPPSGAIAGVMARTDTTRGIWKAPAGLEAGVTGISGISRATSDTVSGTLNPRGINVLRDFPAAGIVVWGARTLRGDDDLASEHKYVPVRRLTDYIASSLYIGTQFAVFEPNDPDLWGQLRLAVTTFMRGLFRQGAFQQSPARDEPSSFFVTCDETTNPQSEIDLGRVNVVVGFAPLKPAEFVVITITQISHLED
jgi:phage tail sheath protein FI